MIVAIDGPAGSGKSTTARMVAQRLGFEYIDTGATYRAVALAVIRNNIDSKDKLAVEELSFRLDIEFEDGKIFLNGENITQAIRNEEVGKIASLCSTYKKVRENMVALQRRLAFKGNIKDREPFPQRNVVCEGRDIGTVVFPDADIKIYMDASLRERAKRRAKELAEKGIYKSLEQVERDLELRDLQDSRREHSPLCVPDGAIIIDTTNLSIEEEVEAVIKIIEDSKIVRFKDWG